MAGIRITVKGLDRLKKRLGPEALNRLNKELDAEAQSAAMLMVDKAKDAVATKSSNTGVLLQGIQYNKLGEGKYEILSGASYSAYVEFGTRSKVQIPPGLQQYARPALGLPGGEGAAKKAIYEWCRLKGIQKEFWFPIYREIMMEGINPQPFFFKQKDAVTPIYLSNIKNIIKRFTNG